MQSKKFGRLILFLLSLSLTLLLVACGGDNESDTPPAESTPQQEAAEAPAATEAQEARSDTAAARKSQQATTVYQAAQLLDLRSLPLPDEATPMEVKVGYLTYQTPLNVAGVVDHYRPLLTGQGWQENSEQAYVDNSTATLYFTQKDYNLNLSASDMGGGATLVTLLNNGNIDLSSLPQMADAEEGFAAPNTLIYFSPSSVTDVADFTRQELAALGWHIYNRPNTATADNADSQTLNFIQNGLELSAFISVAPAQDNKSSVQYTITMLPMDLPVDDQATELEFDSHEPFLSYQTATGREALADFYREQMDATGWQELPDLTTSGAEGANLAFANDTEQLALWVSLAAAEGNQTRVTLHSLSTEDMLADAGDTVDDSSGDVVTDSSGGDLSSFPLPADAENVAYGAVEITFSSPSDVETVVEFYRNALDTDGWQEQSDFSQVDDTFAFVEFDRAGEVIYVTVISFGGASEATIDLSEAASLTGSTGDEATETGTIVDPNAPTYTINDWPVPPEATEVKLSGDELSYKIAWKLQDVADFYIPTFEMMGFGTSCLEDVGDFTSISCSSSTGDLSVNFFAFEGFGDAEVEISFTNYALGSTGDSSGSDSGELTAIDQDGLPLPSDYTGYSSEQSGFRRGLTFTSPTDIETLKEFYKSELAALGWQVVDGKQSGDTTTLFFTATEGPATLTLKPSGGETEGNLFIKNPTAAKEAGILPAAGQARLYMVNFSDGELTVQINNQTFKIRAGAGMDSPDDAPKLDLAPGSYAVKTTAGGSSVTDEVIVGADEVWSLLLDEQGALPLQMY